MKTVIGSDLTPLGREPMWINLENEDWVWDDLAKCLVDRFSFIDLSELLYLIQNRLEEKRVKGKKE